MTRRPLRPTALIAVVFVASVVLVLAAGAAAAGASVRPVTAGSAVGSAAVGVPGPFTDVWAPAVLAADTRSMPATRPATGRQASVTLFSDEFDTWSASWLLFGNPTWGLSSFKADTGTSSAYCIGSQFAAPPAGGYPAGLNSWMVAGPFDLSGWTAGTLQADLVIKTVPWDSTAGTGAYVALRAGVNTETLYGSAYDGDQGDAFLSATLDLTAVPTLGNLCGKPVVYIAFQFKSSAGPSGGLPGAFVDHVRLVGTVAPPFVATVKPASGKVGAWVTIAGLGFGATRGTSYVTFGSKKATGYKAWTSMSLKVKVPAGLKKGSAKVRVKGPGGSSNTRPFAVK